VCVCFSRIRVVVVVVVVVVIDVFTVEKPDRRYNWYGAGSTTSTVSTGVCVFARTGTGTYGVDGREGRLGDTVWRGQIEYCMHSSSGSGWNDGEGRDGSRSRCW